MGIIGLHNHIHHSTEWVVICDSQRGFEFSQLNCLLSWAFSRQDKKIKINGILNGCVGFELM